MTMMDYKKILLEGEKITELIPQKPPIVMIDKLYFSDDTKTVSGFYINENNIFCKNGHLYEPGLIENIAQTVAIRAGYLYYLEKLKGAFCNVPIGYIGAIKNLNIYFLPPVNSEIVTEIIIKNQIFDVTLIDGSIFSTEGKLIADCEMKIFLKRDNA
jgi:3-hydroxyacyl-[acyl-carrier-protein] dehydratase